MLTSAGRERVNPISYPLSESAKIAVFEHVENLFHGLGADGYVALEGKIQGCDCEEDEGDDQGQSGHHENVNQCAIQAEEIGEAYHDDSPDYQHDPEDGRQSVLGFEQAVPSGVRKVAHTLEPLFVEYLLCRGGRVNTLQAGPDLIEQVPRSRTRLLPFHKWPLFVDNHSSVRADQFLNMVTFRVGHPIGYPEVLG